MPDAEPDLAALLPSWTLHLRAERKSLRTVETYRAGVERFLAWCSAEDEPPRLRRDLVEAFLADLLEAGAEPSTAKIRATALRLFSRWAAEEGELPTHALATLKSPRLDEKIVQPLSEAELRALLRACAGKEMWDRRDEAVVRLMLETGARAGEVVAMAVADVDLTTGVAIIRKGKGAKGRLVPFGAKTGQAIDRYLRLRRSHRLADTPTLWLGRAGRGWSYSGLYHSLVDRAEAAGVENFHPHRLRHTAADRWLAAGGSEASLMSIAGWQQYAQMQRYSKARSSQRALDEARRLDLGDL